MIRNTGPEYFKCRTTLMAILAAAVTILMISTSASAQDVKIPKAPMTIHDEAVYIALDATNDLLPDQNLTLKIQKSVQAIRLKFPQLVGKVRNTGSWTLGSALITNHNSKLEDKISASKLGRPQSIQLVANRSNEAHIIFDKPYNPNPLCIELGQLGAEAQPIWYDESNSLPDLGDIRFDPVESTYTFRQGMTNCGCECKENHFWVFVVDDTKSDEDEVKITLQSEYATDIPEQHEIRMESPNPETLNNNANITNN